MNFFNFFRINILLLAIISITFLLPIGVAVYYQEYAVIPSFFIPGIICIALAVIVLLLGKGKKIDMTPRDAFIVVAAAWFFASLLGALPLFFSGWVPSFTDAFFESVSGFTTTGATNLPDVEILPKTINMWRCQMHWLGGMGIVALTVALMPLLGVGGFKLIKAETTGVEKGKVTPKIATTAKILWIIYFSFTIIQTVLLKLAGMDWYDALAHTLSTLGTGGFSTKNTSIAFYHSPAIEWICTIFMFLAGINFSLYYYAATLKFKEIIQNSEFKAYLVIVCITGLGICFFIYQTYNNLGLSLREAFFQTTSIISTTGFSSVNFDLWPSSAQIFLLLLMLVGGCSGSTAGGVKVIRWVILSKQTTNEVKKMLHPHGVFNVQINGRVGRKDVVFSVAGFIFLYFFIIAITALVAACNNIDAMSSITASMAIVGNVGPGLGAVGPLCNYDFFSPATKWWFSFVMIAGRLELYTILIFFMPSFWKK